MQRKVCSRAIGEVTYDHCIWLSSSFMHLKHKTNTTYNDQISDFVSLARIDNILAYVSTSIYALGIRED
jgi:hypothetical protein